MKVTKLFFLLSTLIFLTISDAFAQQSETIFHQGILTDDTGEVVEDGSFIFTFRIYNVETGGESLWTENQVLQVNGGIFNAHLGSEEKLNLSFDEKYWIGVTIDGGDELEPRMPLSAVPYAMHALSVKDGVITGAKLDPDVLQAGANISVELDENNNFVISADTPEGGLLSVSSDSTLKGNGTGESPLGLDYTELFISEGNLQAQSVTGEKLNDNAILSGDNVTVNRDADNNFVISADTPEESPWTVDGSAISYMDGNVGIGTNTPGSMLDVNGDLVTSGNLTADGELRTNANLSSAYSYLRFRDSSGSDGPRLYHSDNENVFFLQGADGFRAKMDLSADGNIAANGELRVNANMSTSLSYLRFRDSNDESGPRFYHRINDNSFNFSGADNLNVFMDLWVGGTITESSDERLKTDIDPLGKLIPALLDIEPVRYRFKEETNHSQEMQIGLIAQQVQKHFPELVREDENGYLSLSYTNLTAVLLKGLQEQQQELDQIKQVLREAGYNLD